MSRYFGVAINSRKQAARKVGHENLFRPEATLEDLDLELALAFFQKSPHGSRPVEEILERYHLLVRDRDKLLITNSALLLFARNPGRWHPRAGVRFTRVSGTELHRGADRNASQLPRLESPIARLIEEAHAFSVQQIGKPEKLHDLFFREVPEYPTFAWQEAIVNVPPEKSGRGARYRVSPELRKERLWLDERLPKLRTHFSIKEILTNADYRTLFGLPRQATVRELKRLTDAKVLDQHGAGRGAHYLPGQHLPKEKRTK